MKNQSNFMTSARAETRAQMMGNYLTEYCTNTSIHGVRYFTERKRHWTERSWWVIAIGLSIWFCSSSIRDIWIKWRDNPVTMNLNEELLPISAIPFPTITICPETKTYKSKLDLVFLTGAPFYPSNVSDIVWSRFKAISHLCYNLWKELEDSEEDFVNASILNLIEDMALNLSDTLYSCDWTSDENCSDIFVPVLTAEGLCFAFNILNSKDIYTENMASDMLKITDRPNISDWSLETGYIDATKKNTYPIHVFSSYKNAGLMFHLQAEEIDVEYVCRTLVPGFKIYLHTPGDVLKTSDYSHQVPFSGKVEISIRPKMLTTAKGLRKYEPSQRQCYFDTERRLRFFKIYTQNNCETDSLANYTFQECGCVKFYMPRNDTTNICGLAKIECYELALEKLFEEDIVDGLSDENAKLFRISCNCLPACTTITYDIEVDRAKYVWQNVFKKDFNVKPEDLEWYASEVSIFFETHQLSMMRREEQYTNTDFLAICGGLLGLCLGVSALSIIEFIYYFTLRLYWSFRNWKSPNLSDPLRQIHHINHVSIVHVMPITTQGEKRIQRD